MEINEENEDDKLFYVDLCGKQMFIKEYIPLVKDDITTESIILFKDALLSTVSKLNEICEMVDSLKNELEEKNLFIRTLLMRDANDTDMINIGLLNKSNIIQTTSNDLESTKSIDVNNLDISISQESFNTSHDDEDDISNESNDNSSLYNADSNIISSLLMIDDCANYSNISMISGDLFSNTSIFHDIR